MAELLSIDAGAGEGGGQVLRTALCLSALQQRPIELHHIRAGRRPAGLAPQHLAAVRAMQMLCEAQVSGDQLGSQDLLFAPTCPPHSVNVTLDISELAGQGSAASVTLLLQTLLLPLALCGTKPSSLTLVGGTHVQWSPCYQYLTEVYLPLLERIGVVCTVELGEWGWYPQGQGTLHARIEPTEQGALSALELVHRGDLTGAWALSAASNLPRHIIERQRAQLEARLWSRHIKPDTLTLDAPSAGKGTVVFLAVQYEEIAAGFAAFGRLHYPADRVADDAFEAFDAYRGTRAALDPHLADQVLLPLALAEGMSHLNTSRITSHLQTAAWLIQRFTGREIEVRGDIGKPGDVLVI